MPDSNRKPEGGEIDPLQMLELELMQKRASWQQAKARRGGLRALSFLFLFVVIVAAIAVFFIFFSPARMQELRSGTEPSAQPTASP
jgi:hypothetical protein